METRNNEIYQYLTDGIEKSKTEYSLRIGAVLEGLNKDDKKLGYYHTLWKEYIEGELDFFNISEYLKHNLFYNFSLNGFNQPLENALIVCNHHYLSKELWIETSIDSQENTYNYPYFHPLVYSYLFKSILLNDRMPYSIVRDTGWSRIHKDMKNLVLPNSGGFNFLKDHILSHPGSNYLIYPEGGFSYERNFRSGFLGLLSQTQLDKVLVVSNSRLHSIFGTVNFDIINCLNKADALKLSSKDYSDLIYGNTQFANV